MANKYLLDSSAWIEYLSGTELGEQAKDDDFEGMENVIILGGKNTEAKNAP